MIVTHGHGAYRPGGAHAATPSAVTIGNFDGVHIGHQAMLARVRAVAGERGLQSCVLTFEPHPREVFTPDSAPTRLTSMREKLELLAAHGVEHTHVAQFTREFAALPCETFAGELLGGTLGARWILVGDDFRFGARRSGDINTLRRLGGAGQFDVETMPTVTQAGARVSSSLVRDALAAGDLALAKSFLGRNYSISGRVLHGDKLGRVLGFPTANVELEHNRPPLTGIFAVWLHGAGPRPLPGADPRPRAGAASLGTRPTVKAADARPVLEVHVLDFDGDLYGQLLRVEFMAKIRDEEKFPDLESLKTQIGRDCDEARRLLNAVPAALS